MSLFSRFFGRSKDVLALTGWGHPHDALHGVAPQARHLEYTHVPSLDEALQSLAEAAKHVHTVVGWSMGGQLAAYAIAKKVIAPKKLVLIAAPYHFVARRGQGLGLKPDIYAQFMDNLRTKPDRTFDKAYALVHHGDARAEQVKEALAGSHARRPKHDWEYWFAALKDVEFDELDFSHFPMTHLVHGTADVVVDAKQSEYFATRLPRAKLHLLEGCGHAPHWHDAKKVQAIIA
jgi:pimeloyl-ACP methyl ester carboxylesterase